MIVTSYHDQRDNILNIVCEVLPRKIRVTLPDKRMRKVYSARVVEYIPQKEREEGEANGEEGKAASR